MSHFVHGLHAGPATAAQLGELGAGLVGLRQLELAVPRGFVISTEAHREAIRAGGRMPPEVWEEVVVALLDLRAESAARSAGERTARSTPAVAVRPSPPARLRNVLPSFTRAGAGAPEPAPARDGRADDIDRVKQAIEAIWRAWDGAEAAAQRDLLGIPPDACTAVVVQLLVGGNERGGRGTVFTRDPQTGSPEPVGSLARVPGADEVAVRLSALRQRLPRELFHELAGAIPLLEASRREVCEISFVVDGERLWFVGVRQAERSAAAAVRIAVDMANEGMISSEEALLRVPLSALLELQAPIAPRQAERSASRASTGLVPAQPAVHTAQLLDWCDERRWMDVTQALPRGWSEVGTLDEISGGRAQRLLLDLARLRTEPVPLRDVLIAATVAGARELGVKLDDIPQGGDLTLPPGAWTLVVSGPARSWAGRLLSARPTRPVSTAETQPGVLETR